MYKGWKKAAAIVLSAVMGMTALAGCSKKDSEAEVAAARAETESKAMITLDGESVSAGAFNFMLRYNMASDWLPSLYRSFYGQDVDVWEMDMYGNGQLYGDQVKESLLQDVKHMLLEQAHMADYGVELTDDDKAAISAAADAFLAENDEKTLAEMSATKENVETMLTLRTIQTRMEEAMGADADPVVSDEEAAQRDVAYVEFTAETETESVEEETEDISEAAVMEDIEEALSEVEENVEEAVSEAEEKVEEAISEAAEQAETAAAVAETEVKTQSADEEATESADEEATESAQEEGTEAAPEEPESETEDPALTAAREAALAQAESFLATMQITNGEGFVDAAYNLAEANSNVEQGTWTFGSDDEYTNPDVIRLTEGLDDNTLVNEVIRDGDDTFYVVYVTDSFNEEATEDRKTEIVEERQQALVDQLLDSWENGSEAAEGSTEAAGEASTEAAPTEGAAFEIDEEAFAALGFDYILYQEEETEDEIAYEEDLTEEALEEISEGDEAQTEEVYEEASETAAEEATETVAEEVTETASETTVK